MLVVPSAIVPKEKNFVIRGLAPQAEIVATEDVEFDARLWEGAREEGLLDNALASEEGARTRG